MRTIIIIIIIIIITITYYRVAASSFSDSMPRRIYKKKKKKKKNRIVFDTYTENPRLNSKVLPRLKMQADSSNRIQEGTSCPCG